MKMIIKKNVTTKRNNNVILFIYNDFLRHNIPCICSQAD